MQRRVNSTIDIISVLFFFVVTITVLFFLLSNIDTDFEFKTTLFFTISFVVLFTVFLIMATIPEYMNFFKTASGKIFFMERIEVKELIYIPLGLGAILGISFVAVQFASPILSVFLSGLVLLYVLIKTQHFLVPVMIHGIYNDIVLLLRQGTSQTFLSQTGISIPEVGITLGNLSQLTSEMIFQIFLVASTEEMMKILIIAFVLLSIKTRFSSSKVAVWVAGVIAVTIWTVFHLIQAM